MAMAVSLVVVIFFAVVMPALYLLWHRYMDWLWEKLGDK